MTKLKENPNVQGGPFRYPLIAAAAGGHKDAVRYLLNSGADPNVVDREDWTVYQQAAFCNHADILRLLLQHPQSVCTLQERLQIAVYVKAETIHHQEILALLIPKGSISLSVIDEMFRNPFALDSPTMLLYIIDNCEVAVFTNTRLLDKCVASEDIGISSLLTFLDRVESIEICKELLQALWQREVF